MGRIIGGIVAGIVAALVVQALIDVVANLIFPAPAIDVWNKKQLGAVFATRPVGALALMVLGYFAGSLAGSYLAKRISRVSWTSWVPAGVMTVLAAIVALAYPIPAGIKIAIVLGPVLGGFIASRLAPRSWPDEQTRVEGADAEV